MLKNQIETYDSTVAGKTEPFGNHCGLKEGHITTFRDMSPFEAVDC